VSIKGLSGRGGRACGTPPGLFGLKGLVISAYAFHGVGCEVDDVLHEEVHRAHGTGDGWFDVVVDLAVFVGHRVGARKYPSAGPHGAFVEVHQPLGPVDDEAHAMPLA